MLKAFQHSFLYYWLLLFACIIVYKNSYTQNLYTTQNTTVKVAVLAPLYIDSAFDGYTYKIKTATLPSYYIPGLDFYNGVMLAIDSLQKQGIEMEVWIYDTKKANRSAAQLVSEMKALKFSLIIASITNATEQKIFSEFSFNENIPLISATYPNDVYLSGNPFFVVLNSTLATHINGIYNFVQKKFSGRNNKLLFLTRAGTMENKIKTIFYANDTLPVKLRSKNIFLYDTAFEKTLTPYLDSNVNNVIICGSLNEAFGAKLISFLSNKPSYKITVIGMPNWSSIKSIQQTSYSHLTIIYSTPFNYVALPPLATTFIQTYKNKLYALPTDMAWKGFETMYHFGHLLNNYRNNFINHLSDTAFTVINTFQIEPTKKTAHSFLPDYMENKKLYFIKITNSQTSVIP